MQKRNRRKLGPNRTLSAAQGVRYTLGRPIVEWRMPGSARQKARGVPSRGLAHATDWWARQRRTPTSATSARTGSTGAVEAVDCGESAGIAGGGGLAGARGGHQGHLGAEAVRGVAAPESGTAGASPAAMALHMAEVVNVGSAK